MADIRLAGNYIPGTGNLGHLQLVYGPNELEVQAPGLPYPIFFGRWEVEPEQGTTVPSGDFSSENYAEQVITFSQDENSDDVWDTLLQMRDDVAAVSGSLPYEIIFNSNSYINTLLNAVGINVSEFLPYPQKVSYYPGVGQDAAQYWGVVWSVTGTAGTNVLVGGTGADEFAGGAGIDFLDGGKGDDHLHGDAVTSSNDSSADYLTGGGGRDTFHVGNTDMSDGLFIYDPVSGTETFNEAARGTYDLILDYSRLDNIEVSWAGGTNTPFSNFQIEAANYTIDGRDVYYSTSGDFQLSAIYDSYFDANLGQVVDVMVFWYQILSRTVADGSPYDVNNPLFAILTPPPSGGRSTVLELIAGTSRDDVLIGTSGDDHVQGGDGADSISGEDGDDVLLGEAGDDDFYSRDGDGADNYIGGSGTNSLIYEGGKDVIFDAIDGTITAATEATDTFTDITVFYGSDGDDTLIAGDNTRLFNGGNGFDTVALSGKVTDYRIYAGGNGFNIERSASDRDLPLDSRWLRLENIENVTFSGVSTVLQNHVANSIAGTSAGETLNGTAGVDLITAGAGNDIIEGSLGSDMIDGGEGTNRLDYSGNRGDYWFKANTDGTITVSHATNGHDVLANIQSILFTGENVEYQIEQLASTAPSDATVLGTVGDDALYGTGGSDVLFGDAGDDYLEGGAGSDIYSFSIGDGNDEIDDWADPTSIDVLRFETGIYSGQVLIRRGDADVWDTLLDLGNGDSVTIKGGFYPGSSVIEEVRFADNTIWSADDLRAIHLNQASTAGDDTILGFLETDDVISAGDGNDTVYGYTGNDQISGGAGDDEIFGNEGNDTILGGTGNDFMFGEAGSDVFVLNAGDGEDWINDFEVGIDKIDLSAVATINNFNDVTATAAEWVAGSTWIYTDENNYVRLEGVSLASLQASDFIFG